ncbi:MAG: 50S ribosomal protein L19 [Bacteroidota bacterium]|nr:50S ribosomal protein L19 [Bacteroidota bacterium]
MTTADINLSKENKELSKSFPDFSAGDTINVHVKIREGNKERVQQFQGTVLQRKNVGSNGETFTVRKISDSIAVEKIMPIFSPSIDKIEVLRRGKVRRARIFYLRKRKGKNAKIKEKI